MIRVNVREFATIPDIDGEAARMMLLVDEPGTKRLFVNDMRGPIYSVSYDGETVTLYLDINDPKWGVSVQSQGRERGFQSFAFHPQFGQAGTPGFGKFYTYTDTTNMTPPPDFTPAASKPTHDTVLLEWTAKTPGAATYDGGAPRELMRLRQPFANHNAGHLAFNPLAAAGTPGLRPALHRRRRRRQRRRSAEAGAEPRLGVRQDLPHRSAGHQQREQEVRHPAEQPVRLKTNRTRSAEIYAYGVRNPQRFAWDSRNGNMFMADIGQNIVEEISPVTAGANLGWNDWEGSFRFISRQAVSLEKPRSDPKMTYPVVEYGQLDPLLQGSSAVTGVVVYRGNAIPQLANLVLFGDNPSGEIFYVNADKLPAGGQDAIRRILLDDNGEPKTMLQVVQAKNKAQGKKPATRVDLAVRRRPAIRSFC